MQLALPLSQMSTADKLLAMEQLWDDLTRDTQSFASPQWHERVLAGREQAAKDGTAKFVDWSKAKQQIRDAMR